MLTKGQVSEFVLCFLFCQDAVNSIWDTQKRCANWSIFTVIFPVTVEVSYCTNTYKRDQGREANLQHWTRATLMELIAMLTINGEDGVKVAGKMMTEGDALRRAQGTLCGKKYWQAGYSCTGEGRATVPNYQANIQGRARGVSHCYIGRKTFEVRCQSSLIKHRN